MAQQLVVRLGLLIIEASHIMVNNKAKLHTTKITIGILYGYYIAGTASVV